MLHFLCLLLSFGRNNESLTLHYWIICRHVGLVLICLKLGFRLLTSEVNCLFIELLPGCTFIGCARLLVLHVLLTVCISVLWISVRFAHTGILVSLFCLLGSCCRSLRSCLLTVCLVLCRLRCYSSILVCLLYWPCLLDILLCPMVFCYCLLRRHVTVSYCLGVPFLATVILLALLR